MSEGFYLMSATVLPVLLLGIRIAELRTRYSPTGPLSAWLDATSRGFGLVIPFLTWFAFCFSVVGAAFPDEVADWMTAWIVAMLGLLSMQMCIGVTVKTHQANKALDAEDRERNRGHGRPGGEYGEHL